MKTNILTLAITLTVGIILVGSFLMPVISDATDDEVVFMNDGTYRMSALGEDTITFHYANEVYTVNGVEFTGHDFPVIQNDNVMFYAPSWYAGFQYIINDQGYTRYPISGSTDLTMIYNGATKTVSITSISGGNTYTSERTFVNEVYYADPEGDYIWSAAKPATVYVPSDWVGFNCWSNEDIAFYSVMGDIVKVNGVTDTDASIELVTESVENCPDVKTITSYSVTLGDDSTLNCRGWILPYKVVGHDVTKLTEYESLLTVIPILVIISLILASLSMIYLKTRD